MEPRLAALKLFLAELGISETIHTVDDRKRVQKAVYLGQLTGVDLSYRFGWYRMGPYSPALTRDYYSLAEADEPGNGQLARKGFSESVRRRLQSIQPILQPPPEIPLPQEDWLELISSLHFLRKISGFDRSQSLDVLHREKPRLAAFADVAEKKLVETQLLPA